MMYQAQDKARVARHMDLPLAAVDLPFELWMLIRKAHTGCCALVTGDPLEYWGYQRNPDGRFVSVVESEPIA